jgi:hypothetical protein
MRTRTAGRSPQSRRETSLMSLGDAPFTRDVAGTGLLVSMTTVVR